MSPGPIAEGRGTTSVLAAAVLALGVAAAPADAGTVVLLKSGSLGPYNAAAAGFLAAYPPGAVVISLEDGAPDAVRQRLLEARPEVIVTVGLKAAAFARDRLPRVPMVFCVVQNFDRYDLAGDWVTGVSTDVPARVELEAMRTACPEARRIGLIYGVKSGAALAREARAAAAAAHLGLIEAPVSDLQELQAKARDLVGRVDVLWMPADPTVATPEVFRYLLRQSLERRMPLLVFSEALVRAGALMAVSPDYAWVGARVADAVRRIQSGERAGDIPVAALHRTRLILNASTSHALGRELPAPALRSAEVLR